MIPIRMLNEYVYCPRLFYLEYVQGLFIDNSDTIYGSFQHERSSRYGRKIRHKVEKEDTEENEDQIPLFTKNLSLTSEKLGITGKLDAIEEENNHYAPVELKNSAGTESKQHFLIEKWELFPDAWPNDQIQLCAQGLLLRDNGFNSDYGYIYYRGAKERIKIDFNLNLINATLEIIKKAVETSKNSIPPPLVDSQKCIRCSLNAFCTPDELNFITGKIEEPRRIIPGRDDAGVLYVITQGARVSKSGETIVIEVNREKVDEVPIKDISHLVLVGHVQITTEAMHLLMSSQRTISFLGADGKMIGTASAPITKNVLLRVAQYKKFENQEFCLKIAKEIITAKIENQRTILRRNGENIEEALSLLKNLSTDCNDSKDKDSLRGFEGKASQVYFNIFPSLIKKKEIKKTDQLTFNDLPECQDWNKNMDSFFAMKGRNKRPPRDPVNAMLSFGYTLLLRDMISAIIGTGMDPYYGFYHTLEIGRPSLALDMMEPFRPIIVDSLILRLINTGEIKPSHFYITQTEVQLTREGRFKFLEAYERRMDELITHPVFGYRISYRRILDVECRLFGRHLTEEINFYKPLRTR